MSPPQRLVNHPFERNAVILPTPAMNGVLNVIASWVGSYATGGLVYGTQRAGKSKTIEYLMKSVHREDTGYTPTFWHCMDDEKYADELHFQSALLYSTDYDLPNPRNISVARMRVVDHLKCQAQQAYTNRVLLFIDDAQWLLPAQFHWLMTIHNKLQKAGVTLTVILVGQPELETRATHFSDDRGVIARFLAKKIRFPGISNARELRSIFAMFDDKTEYPADSGISYTAAYIPQAFSKGFRLKTHAKEIFDAFQEVSLGKRRKQCAELTMQTVMTFLLELLRDLSVNDSYKLELSKEAIHRSITMSGFSSLELFDY